MIALKGGTTMLILASSSSRRAKLLKDAGLEFIIDPSHVEEIIKADLKPEEIVVDLALQKGKAVFQNHLEDTVIAADTIVVFGDQILGKPENEEDAYNMLKLLSNDTHCVYTGVAILKGDKEHVFYTKSEVTMKALSDLEIHNYIKTGEPMDKAGAYGIQGNGGELVDHFNGDFFTIVGLPLKNVLQVLQEIEA